MRKSGYSRLFRSFPVSIIALLLIFPLWFAGYLEGWENKAGDMAQRLLAKPSAYTDDILLILLDQQSIDWVNDNLGISWPWPRELHGAVIDNCVRRGAKAIGVDVLFTESSMFGVADDRKLGEAIAKAPALALGSVTAGELSGSYTSWPDDLPRPDLQLSNKSDTPPAFPVYSRALLPVKEVGDKATIYSNTSQKSDRDGIYRRLHPLVFFDDVLLPPLGVGMYLATSPEAGLELAGHSLRIGDRTLPLDSNGQVMLRFRGAASRTFTSLSSAPLIHTEINRRQDTEMTEPVERDFAGKYLLYGFSAPGLLDLRPTPVGGKTAGVELHATMLDNILANDFLVPVPSVYQVIWYAGIVFTASLILLYYSSPLQQLWMMIFMLFFPVTHFLVTFTAGYRTDFLPLQSALTVTTFLAVLYNYLTEGKERRFIKHMFNHYLSPDVIEELLRHPEKLKLGGERKEISIFFSDLKGFTSISEGLEPEVLTELLNDYLTAMTDIILEEGGTIDKYEGDAIIAFWNAPLALPDHGVRAVRAALRCQEELARMRPELKTRCGHDVHMRIGVNTGEAVVGNLGSASRFDYTMLGDSANLAARLEGVNKIFGTWTLISESTKQYVESVYPLREVGQVVVVGRKEAVTIYEPFLPEIYEKIKPEIVQFAKALKFFMKGDLATASELFDGIAGSDPVAAAYLDRCSRHRKNEETEWTGVWHLGQK